MIPTVNTLKFMPEAEFKYKIIHLSNEEKIKELFECYDLLRITGNL